MEKCGFVYIWYDNWRKMYYIGSHWGTKDDGYICSSNRMRKAYRRRPDDFKRRIIQTVNTNRKDLLLEEYKWLQLIPENQLGKKYYNLRRHHYGHWTSETPEKVNFVIEKITKSLKGRSLSPKTEIKPGQHLSPETQFKKGMKPYNIGKTLEEQYNDMNKINSIKKKMSDAKMGKRFSPETEFQKGVPSWNKGLKRIMITNGKITKCIYGENAVIPDGWKRGRLYPETRRVTL